MGSRSRGLSSYKQFNYDTEHWLKHVEDDCHQLSLSSSSSSYFGDFSDEEGTQEYHNLDEIEDSGGLNSVGKYDDEHDHEAPLDQCPAGTEVYSEPESVADKAIIPRVENLSDVEAFSSLDMFDNNNCKPNEPKSFNDSTSKHFVSEDVRNRTYDSWFDACERWEKMRLMWLCEIAKKKGHDESKIIQTTFLEYDLIESSQAGSSCHLSNNENLYPQNNHALVHMKQKLKKENDHYRSFPSSDDVCILEESIEVANVGTKDQTHDIPSASTDFENQDVSSEKFEVWEEWYRIERLYRHMRLYYEGLPNWYEELVCEEEQRCEQGKSMYSSLEQALAQHDELSKQLCHEKNPDDGHSLKEIYEEPSVYDMRIYQLTDPYFWFDGCKNYF